MVNVPFKPFEIHLPTAYNADMKILDGLDAILITHPTNIRYLTGFSGADPTDREAYALITKNKTHVFTSALYIEQAKTLKHIEIIQISREHPISAQLMRICEQLGIKKLGFEEVNLTVAELHKLNMVLEDITLVPTRDRIEQQRQIKRADEIANIKKACVITDACFDFILKKLKPGVRERDVAWDIETFFRKNDATSAFSPIAAFGKNSSQPHHQSDATALGKNDLVLLDFGARYNGYCADMTRVVFVGKPKPVWVDTYTTVLASQQKALDLLAAGERHGATLDAAAQEVIAEAELPPYPHSLGHTIGLDIHEGPRLTVKKDEGLLPGMVFSVEPGVYIEGSYGIRIEDLVRLTDTGVKLLSKSPKELMIL